MRRLTLILSLATLMALLVSAAAFAANISVSSVIGFRTVFGESSKSDLDAYEFKAQRRLYSSMYFRGSKGPVSATVRYYIQSLRGSSATDGWVDLDSSNWGSLSLANSDLVDAYLDFKGEIIPGLPGGTLRIGRFSTNQNGWIADFSRRNAVMLSGVKLGPATLTFYQAMKGTNTRATMVKATGKIDIVDLTAVYVGHSNLASDTTKKNEARTDLLFGATVTPNRDMKITAEVATNGKEASLDQDPAMAWKVSGELNSIPNFKLRASTWSTDTDFRPDHFARLSVENLRARTIETGGARPGSMWGDPWMETGFSVGVTTTQVGLPFDVDVKIGTIFESNVPGSGNGAYAGEEMIVASVGTTVAQIKTNATVTMIGDHDPVIDLVGERSVRVGLLNGNVNLRGIVRLIDEDTNFAADAIWDAPNGLKLGLHYANYDRGTNWNHNTTTNDLSEGIDVGKAGKADGFSITAGYQLSF